MTGPGTGTPFPERIVGIGFTGCGAEGAGSAHGFMLRAACAQATSPCSRRARVSRPATLEVDGRSAVVTRGPCERPGERRRSARRNRSRVTELHRNVDHPIDRLVLHRDDDIAGADAGRCRWAVLCDGRDLGAPGRRRTPGRRVAEVDPVDPDPRVRDVTGPQQLLGDRHDVVRRNRGQPASGGGQGDREADEPSRIVEHDTVARRVKSSASATKTPLCITPSARMRSSPVDPMTPERIAASPPATLCTATTRCPIRGWPPTFVGRPSGVGSFSTATSEIGSLATTVARPVAPDPQATQISPAPSTERARVMMFRCRRARCRSLPWTGRSSTIVSRATEWPKRSMERDADERWSGVPWLEPRRKPMRGDRRCRRRSTRPEPVPGADRPYAGRSGRPRSDDATVGPTDGPEGANPHRLQLVRIVHDPRR